ncbi:MAG: hypothetical protein RL154_423 [Pseudomonadota bacterium]|jgi:16S rRNA (guanine(966)-N(2))-methyltransferase RsmD
MTQSNKIRVSGGKFKGRSIEMPDNDITRSSKSIVRESVINTLQTDLLDSTFVEVFAGSGSVGIEAISRGAGYAIFCEKDRLAYNFLQKNLHALQIENAKVYLNDSFTFFPSILELSKNLTSKAIFYFDPPFDLRDGMSEIYVKVYELIGMLDKNFTICAAIEARTGITPPEKIGEFKLEKSKTFGHTTVFYYM